MTAYLSPRSALVAQTIVIACLTLASAIVNVLYVQQGWGADPPKVFNLFTLMGEVNLPTWYQTLALASCASVTFTIGLTSLRVGPQQSAYPWFLLAITFLYLSLDEFVGVHEYGTPVVEMITGAEAQPGLFKFLWVYLALPFVAMFVIVMTPFLLRLSRPTALGFVASGALFVGGAIGLELAGGFAPAPVVGASTTYLLVSNLEEVFEMVAIALFRYVAASYLHTGLMRQ